MMASAVGQHQKGQGIQCKLEEVQDSEKSGLTAFTYFVPDGWTAHHSMRWGNADSFVANLSASTADKHYSVSQLQPMVVTYMAMRAIAPKGIRIAHATDFLHALVDQLKRQYNLQEVNVVDEVNEPLPLTQFQESAARTNWGPMQTRAPLHESGFMQVTFELNGEEETADLGTTVVGTNVRMHALNNENEVTSESGVYRAGPSMVIIAPSNPAGARIREARIIASTMRETPQFLAYHRKLTTALAKAQLQANAAELEANNADWHERSMANFKGQMAAKDSNTHEFCNYILDQQDYKTKSGPTVTLPTAFDHAWSNANGEYLLSDNPAFDPRGYGSGGWERLEKTK